MAVLVPDAAPLQCMSVLTPEEARQQARARAAERLRFSLHALRSAATGPFISRLAAVSDTASKLYDIISGPALPPGVVFDEGALGDVVACLPLLVETTTDVLTHDVTALIVAADVLLKTMFATMMLVVSANYFDDPEAEPFVYDADASWNVVSIMKACNGSCVVAARGMSVLALLGYNRVGTAALFDTSRPLLQDLALCLSDVDPSTSLCVTVAYMHWLTPTCYNADEQIHRLIDADAFSILPIARLWLARADSDAWKVSVAKTVAAVLGAIAEARCRHLVRLLANERHEAVATLSDGLRHMLAVLDRTRDGAPFENALLYAETLVVVKEILLTLKSLTRYTSHHAALAADCDLQATLLPCLALSTPNVCKVLRRLVITGNLTSCLYEPLSIAVVRQLRDRPVTTCRSTVSLLLLLLELAQGDCMSAATRRDASETIVRLLRCPLEHDAMGSTDVSYYVLHVALHVFNRLDDAHAALQDGLCVAMDAVLDMLTRLRTGDRVTCLRVFMAAWRAMAGRSSASFPFPWHPERHLCAVVELLHERDRDEATVSLVSETLDVLLKAASEDALTPSVRELIFVTVTSVKATTAPSSADARALACVLAALRPSAPYMSSLTKKLRMA